MARKPIDLEFRGLRTPRERVWAAVLAAPARFTPMQVQDLCNPMVQLEALKDYLDGLANAGYLVRAGGGQPMKKGRGLTEIEYQVVKRPAEAPRVTRQGQPVTQGTATLSMWRAMKVLKVFDWHELAVAATLNTCIVKPATAKAYCKLLTQAGYLQVVRAGKPGMAAKLRLAKNTGPHAPAITRRKVVFDRNVGSFVDLETAQEVCDGLE